MVQHRRPIGLPLRPILYTQDQIAVLLNLSKPSLSKITFYEGRHTGAPPPSYLVMRNIAAEGEKPEWRCAEQELIRFLKYKGYTIYDRAYVAEQ